MASRKSRIAHDCGENVSTQDSMSNPFFDHPILNSPYARPARHWELDAQGQPTQKILETRRRAEFITPIPKPKKRKKAAKQDEFVFDEGKGLSTKEQQYDPTSIINEVRESCGRVAGLAQSQPMAGHAGNGPPASALAASQVQRHPPVLLPGGGGRNRDLADRGRAAVQERQALARPPCSGQQETPIPN